MKTKIAIPAWQDRISPVFDTAGRVLVLELYEQFPGSGVVVDLPAGSLQLRVDRLAKSGVDVLLCGAISWTLQMMLEDAGISVRPFLKGPVDELIRAYVEDRLSDPRYIMPGCCGRNRRRTRLRGTGKRKEEKTQ